MLGGWRLGQRVVCHEDNVEDLDQLTRENGLALVPLVTDVHPAQYGNLSRLVALLESTPVDAAVGRAGVGIDEGTVLGWGGAHARVCGTGRVWWCERTDRGVEV